MSRGTTGLDDLKKASFVVDNPFRFNNSQTAQGDLSFHGHHFIMVFSPAVMQPETVAFDEGGRCGQKSPSLVDLHQPSFARVARIQLILKSYSVWPVRCF
jgi:hypothetical protein